MTIRSKSNITFLLFVLIVLIGRILLDLFPFDHMIIQQPFFQWSHILVVLALGVFAQWLSAKAGIKEIWDPSVPNRKRIGYPVFWGLIIVTIQILITTAVGVPNINVPLKYAFQTYFPLGTLLELLFHFIPMVVLLWITWSVIAKKRYRKVIFWIIAILISLYEPYTQIGGLIEMEILSGALEVVTFFAMIFFANLIPLILFEKYGLLSMILFRYIVYLIWHILWPLIYF